MNIECWFKLWADFQAWPASPQLGNRYSYAQLLCHVEDTAKNLRRILISLLLSIKLTIICGNIIFVLHISSSIGTATLVGFGLLNYRWVFSAGRFLQSAIASGTSNPQPGGPSFTYVFTFYEDYVRLSSVRYILKILLRRHVCDFSRVKVL